MTGKTFTLSKIIALDRKAVEAEHDDIPATYEIPGDRSEALIAEAGGDEMKTDGVASTERGGAVHLRQLILMLPCCRYIC